MHDDADNDDEDLEKVFSLLETDVSHIENFHKEKNRHRFQVRMTQSKINNYPPFQLQALTSVQVNGL